MKDEGRLWSLVFGPWSWSGPSSTSVRFLALVGCVLFLVFDRSTNERKSECDVAQNLPTLLYKWQKRFLSPFCRRKTFLNRIIKLWSSNGMRQVARRSTINDIYSLCSKLRERIKSKVTRSHESESTYWNTGFTVFLLSIWDNYWRWPEFYELSKLRRARVVGRRRKYMRNKVLLRQFFGHPYAEIIFWSVPAFSIVFEMKTENKNTNIFMDEQSPVASTQRVIQDFVNDEKRVFESEAETSILKGNRK